MMITAIGKCQKGRETGYVTVIDNVLRKALTEKITRDLKKEWAQGKSEASAQLVLGASYCLALQGTEILCLLCWVALGLWSKPVQSPQSLDMSCYFDLNGRMEEVSQSLEQLCVALQSEKKGKKKKEERME